MSGRLNSRWPWSRGSIWFLLKNKGKILLSRQLLFAMLLVQVWGAVASAQSHFLATIIDAGSKEPLIGANVLIEALNKGASSDVEGEIVLEGIPNGNFEARFSYIGYQDKTLALSFPDDDEVVFTVELEPAGEELETVTVSTTRSSRQIQRLPTRIEAITAEELGEQAAMNSANIAMLLKESTGIQVQQTSANSANQSIRIQGLDGRYTQILKDGFPLFGGFSGGLSVMQIPPLDLYQVEIIKGSISTLYGGGAIAGLVNLITKQPGDNPELSFMYTQTQALGSTFNGFYSQQYGKAGLTFYASGHYQKAYDNNQDDFTDLPQTKSISINPSFFYAFSETAKLRISLNTTFENRWGGDASLIKNNGPFSIHQFSERNLSGRIASMAQFEKRLSKNTTLIAKNSINYFDRSIELPEFIFQGRQTASFSEVALNAEKAKSSWVAGLNLWTDQFEEGQAPVPRDYANHTFGFFGQHTWQASRLFSLESGLRADYHSDYRWFVLPRLSALLSISSNWTMRIGGGLGYQAPTIFTEESERLAYRNILPIAVGQTEAETSIGGNFDINYRAILFDKATIAVNNLLFYTRLSHPLVLNYDGFRFFYKNASGALSSKGLETNLKLTVEDITLYLNYTLLDVQLDYNGIQRPKPLTPRHNLGTSLMYETEKWRLGYEAYYTGRQFLDDKSRVRDYWTMGFMAMRTWPAVSLFINFENMTDVRQSRYQNMFEPPHQSPVFQEIWAPTDGFIFTVGAKVDVLGGDGDGKVFGGCQ